jgi:hypothetical protein
MGRINTFAPSGEAERADPSNETVINGAPYVGDQTIRSGAENPVGDQTIRSGAENPAASVDRPDAPISKEIRRRQVSLAVRYVAALRAR